MGGGLDGVGEGIAVLVGGLVGTSVGGAEALSTLGVGFTWGGENSVQDRLRRITRTGTRIEFWFACIRPHQSKNPIDSISSCRASICPAPRLGKGARSGPQSSPVIFIMAFIGGRFVDAVA